MCLNKVYSYQITFGNGKKKTSMFIRHLAFMFVVGKILPVIFPKKSSMFFHQYYSSTPTVKKHRCFFGLCCVVIFSYLSPSISKFSSEITKKMPGNEKQQGINLFVLLSKI